MDTIDTTTEMIASQFITKSRTRMDIRTIAETEID